MQQENIDSFPLSRKHKFFGTRRVAREKVMQILVAHRVCREPVDQLFDHIYFRRFNFDESHKKLTKLLTPDEVYELEADIPLKWNNDLLSFGKLLLEKTLKNTDFIDQMIDRFAKNWDLERVATVDRIIIQIAATEFMEFDDIPPKVTINEAIDISKKYSTTKSKIFINGILDSILSKLKKEGNLSKVGRGLRDQ